MDKGLQEFMEIIYRNKKKLGLEIVDVNSKIENEMSKDNKEVSKNDIQK